MSEEKIKVFDLANELNIRSLDLVNKINDLGINVKSHMSSLSEEEAQLVRSKLKPKEAKKLEKKEEDISSKKKTIIRRKSSKLEEDTISKEEELKLEALKEAEKLIEPEVLVSVELKAEIPKETEEEKKDKFLKKHKPVEEEIFSKKKEPKKKLSKREVKKEELNIKEIKATTTGRALYGQKKRPQAGKSHKKTLITTMKESKRKLRIASENILVSNLAKEMGVKVYDLIKKLKEFDLDLEQNSIIDIETAKMVANDFSYNIEFTGFEESKVIKETKDEEKDLISRPPVVTMMGHVDHGKTSILDAIRKSRVVDKEAGGITQHIGAYKVSISRGDITFIDTPGHEAFSQMRARGSKVTDIVVLVVAADDGVMPQTRESIAHAKAAGVEIVVAVNKIDKPEANFDRIKQQLADLDLLCEEWGGQTILVPTSATKNEGIDKLLDAIILQSEVMELKANPNREPEGIIIEAKLDKGMGSMATVIVQNGTLKVGDFIVAGTTYGKIRSIRDSYGKNIKELKPSEPGELLGLIAVPEAGDKIFYVKNEADAKKLISHRLEENKKQASLNNPNALSLEELMNKVEEDIKILNLLIKADTKGTSEALKTSLLNLTDSEVKINIVYTGTGAINTNDVNLAIASAAIIIAFNVRADVNAYRESELNKIQIREYNIIYKCIEDMEKLKKHTLGPIEKTVVNGHAEVRQTFSVPKIGLIAGCSVTDGKIIRNSKIRVTRDGVIIHTGKIKSLKHFKDDVKEISSGNECGIGIENFNDIKIGDILESYTISFVEVAGLSL